MADKVDPAEDIIDILYSKANEDQSKKRAANYGFEYQNPPSRNYYEDLYQIQRRQFHGLDSGSVFSMPIKRPLTRTDSRSTSFSFSLPSQQERMRRSLVYGSLRSGNKTVEDSVDDDFFTPESEEPQYDKWMLTENSSKSSGIYNSIDSGLHQVCSTAVYDKKCLNFLLSDL